MKPNSTIDTINALQAILGPTEAIWITSQGSKLFKIDLTGIMDNERKIDKYLKIRKAQPRG